MPAIFDVIVGIQGAFDHGPQRRHRPHPFVEGGVLPSCLPDSDLPVLVAGEDSLSGDDDGLDEAGVGFESREFLLILPHADALALGAGVEEVAGGR